MVIANDKLKKSLLVGTFNENFVFKETLENAEEKRFLADDKYLTLLGFTEHPRLYPAAIWKNTSLPIIVTYVSDFVFIC
jgi:hypothetical protein